MKIKPLDWKQTSFRRITYNRHRRTSETWEAATGLFGVYKVWQAVGGRCFVEVPHWWQSSSGSHLRAARRPCHSVAHGKQIAEDHWQQQAAKAFASEENQR